ncbi:DUF6422 family protein [Streptomyces sp. NPDC093795]|uniref:DUF6422 family protein n=1 Tax=Streptomyces sp. NPDC093795 TaxID=3366051 RepID=UPI0037F4B576
MSYPTDGLSDDQVQALREAARLVRQARVAAADILTRSGIDPGLASVRIGALDFCTAMQSPGPPIRACGCPGFRGDSDFCFSQYEDFTGPDFGEGAIIRICGHPRKAHEAI